MFYEGEAGLGIPGLSLSARLCQGLTLLGWGKHCSASFSHQKGFAGLEGSQL